VASVEQVLQLREPLASPRTLEELYDLHAPGLRRRCQRLTGDPDAAEDLTQEVFVRFMARFPEPPAGMHVAGYLYAAARNILWKQLRDDHELADGEIETTVGSDDDLEIDPERSILLLEQQRLVRRCSAVLTGRQRRALMLRDVEGHSYAEIGSDLGVGTDAVAQMISRARARLRVAVRRAHVDVDQLSPECRAMLGPLSDYLDGHAATSSTDIEGHLAGCESCRSTLSAFRGAGSRLRGTLPIAPLSAVLARIGEAVRLGSGAPVDAVRAGAVAVAAALAIGGGGMFVAHETMAGSHAHAASARSHALEVSVRAPHVAPTPAARPTTRRPGTAPAIVRGRHVTDVTPQRRAGHPGTPVSSRSTPISDPTTAVTTPAVSPGSAPPVMPDVTSPTTQPAVTPGASKPATTPAPPTAGGTGPPAGTTPADPTRNVTPTVDRVVTPVVTKVVTPIVNRVVTPIVDKVVTPVVEKVVDPVVTKVVAPITAPVTKALAPVTDPVVNAVTPVTDPVTKAVAPVTEPVTKAVAPVTDPVTKLVGGLLPLPETPSTTATQSSSPAPTSG
jgi:RNA polymerase sigma factor (sigma-70 family)